MTDPESVRAALERLQAATGVVHRRDLGRVGAADIAGFAAAGGDADPRYRDERAARSVGLPGVVAPPLLLTSVMGWDADTPEERLRPDGSDPAVTDGLPLEGLRLMGAGQDLEFHAPLVCGTGVLVETSIESVRLKEGRSGPLLLITVLRRYRNDDAQELVTCRESVIAR